MHSIQIPDEIWDAYDGSPMKMRAALAHYLMLNKEESPNQSEKDSSKKGARRTLILRYDDWCRGGYEDLPAGTDAVWIKRAGTGTTEVYCLEHAPEE
jgi:hypothetical protein